MRPTAGRGLLVRAATVVVAVVLGVAHGQSGSTTVEPDPVCPPSGGPTIAVDGFGTISFGAFSTDAEADRATFTDGACVEAEDGSWTLAGDRLVIVGLRGGDPEIVVDRALVRTQTTELRTRRLEGTTRRLGFDGVALVLSDAVGAAQHAVLDLERGVLELAGAHVRTRSFDLFAASATVDENGVRTRDAVLTPCRCEDVGRSNLVGPDASAELRYRLAGEEIVLEAGDDSDAPRATVVDAVVGVGPAALELGDVTLDDGDLATLFPPVRFGVPEGPDALADTVSLLVGPAPLASVAGADADADLEVGITGFGVDGPTSRPRPVGRVRAAAPVRAARSDVGRARASVALAAEGPRVDVDVTRTLAPWLDLELGLRQSTPGGPGSALVDATASMRASWDGGPVAGVGLSAYARPEVAASAERGETGDVLGSRLGVALGASATIAVGGGISAHLSVEGSTAIYPQQTGPVDAQHAFRVRPRLVWTAPGARAELGYDRRVVAGRSPFSSAIDRLEPLERIESTFDLEGVSVGSGRLSAHADVGLRLGAGLEPAGMDRLRADVTWNGPGAQGVWTAAMATHLEGVVGPDVDADAWVEASAGYDATPPRANGRELPAFETTVRVRYGIETNRIDDAEIAAAVPFEASGVWIRPYVAVDVADLARGERGLSGHGLELTWDGCCGALTVGYRTRDDVTSLVLRYALPDRPLDPADGSFDVLPAMPRDGGALRSPGGAGA